MYSSSAWKALVKVDDCGRLGQDLVAELLV
jgi:hypothetical protein